ncbi:MULTISPECIES: hypothetical protein [Tenacibaculum]|uniref:hypothetical protein n=1 Tax=Tenacibaculum TaxID=104267 RepID=UPI001F0ADA31|nr:MULTISPECIES: hypothetical protein [Tenacibaculum]MCH3881658.1 hypothetical protein [Tenacibaculum aquimarinum]MCH3883450.1 hypothetical protein [Tenacibaculum aquimarinum]MDO6598757.1 hypothetical protein [Tenacibaculum sp. 1_MG-2023]
MSVSNIGLTSQILVAILSVVLIKKYKSPFYLFLCIFFIVAVFTELMGAYNVDRYRAGKSTFNHLPLAAFLQFNSLALMYMKLIRKNRWIKIILGLSVLFSVSCIVVYFHYDMFSYLLVFGCLNTSLFSFLYLRELLLSDKILNYKKHFPFWVSVGLLVFYLPTIPFFINMPFMKGRSLFFLLELLIVFMNLFIMYGLLCSKKEVKY